MGIEFIEGFDMVVFEVFGYVFLKFDDFFGGDGFVQVIEYMFGGFGMYNEGDEIKSE